MKRVVIIGAGISGLTTAYLLKKELPVEVTIIEKELRVGGVLGSTRGNGYVIDWAANGFLNDPNTLELIKSLNLESELQEAAKVAKHRFIYIKGNLTKVPTSPPALFKSKLLSSKEKLRLLGDFFCKASEKEETVFNFFKRRFGKGVADIFAGIFVLGIAAGDAKELSLDALFPILRKMEKENGSLIKALINRRQQVKKGRKP